MTSRRFQACFSFALLASAATMAAEPQVDFDKQIAPLLAEHCFACHGPSSGAPEGNLPLHSRASVSEGGDSGPAVVGGDLKASVLWDRVAADEMPPKHPLNAEDKALIKTWIVQGAEWGADPIDPFAFSTTRRAGRDWWSLQPLRQVEPPLALLGDGASEGREIDALIRQGLRKRGLSPSPPAERRDLLRRIYFDLIGLPPSWEQMAAFESAADLDAAYEATVNKLLASEHYGERWGRHWLDVVRFGESDGFERNHPRRDAWHYRDWVINALNDDMPYDQFVHMQLIGDQLQPGYEGAAATGFWVAGVHNTVVGGSERMKKLARQDEIEEVLATLGQSFLGLTINCARCHDHKFDPVSQQEFYQLASAISGLRHGAGEIPSAAAVARLKELDGRIAKIQRQRETIRQRARDRILAARADSDSRSPSTAPTPFARWDFEGDYRDSVGQLHGKPHGNAKVENGALVVDGQSFVETEPLPTDVGPKTLEALVQVETLEQAGGGVITLETTNGVVFDSIVFAEREPKRWMAGSNGFVRTDSFGGPEDVEAAKQPIHLVFVYHQDGRIIGYRNGVPYGHAIRKSGLQSYKGRETEFIFGLRHKPPGGNRFLKAKIHHAAFYNRALTASEVEAAAANATNFVSSAEIKAWLAKHDPSGSTALLEHEAKLADLGRDRETWAQRAKRRVYSLNPQAGAKTHVLLRGDPVNVGALVAPGGVSAVQGVSADFSLAADAPESQRRRALAEWIASDSNPMFARVIVNRVWHYHFGVGIVDTPNDLGFNGGRPSHPELLEWLAADFLAQGMHLKRLHKQIVLSSTYRQSTSRRLSAGEVNPKTIDANNRLLWRMSPRRLEAEAFRDAMLAVAGQLNTVKGGPSFEDVSVTLNNGTTYYSPLDVDGPEFFRRSVYRFNPRGGRSALLDTLDCPDPAATAPKRAVTTTPLQALSVLNNSLVLRMSEYFAERVAKEAGEDERAQVSAAWRLAMGREPTEYERRLSEKLVSEHGLPALCRGLYNAHEFIVIP